MEGERDRNDQGDAKPVDEAEALNLILALAEALRAEFGVSVDAHPGGEGNEAGVVNRAFQAAVRVVLGQVIPFDQIPLAVTLRNAALRRLAELRVRRDLAERILDSEPALGDGWMAYLSLAPASVVEDLLISRFDERLDRR